MYDELVKALRVCVDEDKDCLDCPYYSKCMSNDSEKHKAIVDAADAIEELQQIAGHYEESAHDYFKDVCYYLERVPKWIPVTERLPEKANHYLVYIECKCSAWMQVAWFCEKFYWEHMHGDDVFKETVTHWMPLPEPPKEGET